MTTTPLVQGLSAETVIEARRLYKRQRPTVRELADRFGVSPSVMYYALTGETWKQVNEAEPPVSMTRRRAKGEDVHAATLTAEQVIEARDCYYLHGVKAAELAQLYGVHLTTMHRALKGTTWKHLPMPI